MHRVRFPYHDKSLNGVFGYGIRKLKLNIRYEVSLSSLYLSNKYWSVLNCFDGKPETYCHTNASAGEYIQVHFLDLFFKIEGFAIQNRADGFHNPLNYVIKGSKNGSFFDNISSFEENPNDVCTNGTIRTNRVKTNTKYSYFRLQMTGMSCTGLTTNMNMAEFDLFGSFGDMTICLQQINRKLIFLSRMGFVLMIVYS